MASHWKRLEECFFEALDQPPEEREAYLRKLSGEAPDLADEVRLLLRHHAAGATLSGVDELVRELSAQSEQDDQLPSRLGPYRPVRELGRGGMGRVFLAIRDEFTKRVALKVVRGSAAAPDRVDQFLKERDILARLEHPGIAQLYDAGVSDEGLPYFAMEYVEGTDLMSYCDAQRLSVRRRLELFTEVCEAVTYAHAQLVVHRDLKPSNILVTRDGRPKLLDFGVAKLLLPDPGSTATEAHARRFTPGYASPEQIGGTDVTTASDVYQLGVLLYELISGRSPFVLSELTPAQAGHIIRTVDPSAPSSASSARTGTGLSSQELAQLRDTTIAGLEHILAGDLDAIALRALEKDPGDRYPSVEALRADVVRHLESRPVLARPQTRWTRFRKMVARNKVAAAATTVLVLYAVSLTGAVVQAVIQRNRALQEAARVEAVLDFVIGLFDESNPAVRPVETETTALDIVERGAERVEELADRPEMHGTLLYSLGVIFHNLSSFDRSEALLNEVLQLDDSLGVLNPDRRSEAQMALAQMLLMQGRGDESEELFRRLLSERDPTGEDMVYLRALNGVASALHAKGQRAAGDSVYAEWESLVLSHEGVDDPDVAAGILSLGQVRLYQGAYEEAETLIGRAVTIFQKAHHPDHPAVVNATTVHGELLLVMERFDEADQVLSDAVARARRSNPEGSPIEAAALSHHANTLMWLDRLDEAAERLRASIELNDRFLGEDDPSWPNSRRMLGSILHRQGDYASADALLESARDWWFERHGAGHPFGVVAGLDHASNLRALGRADEAERELLELFETVEPIRGADDSYTQRVVRALVALYDGANRPHESARFAAMLNPSS